jgi:starch synthase (maltosyl-transferring)
VATSFRTVIIESVYPEFDAGRYPVKRVVGDDLVVEADIFREGHDLLMAGLKYRGPDQQGWHRVPMRLIDNDRWCGSFQLSQIGRYCYTIEATPDLFRSWTADLQKKAEAGQDVASDRLEGERLLQSLAARAAGVEQELLHAAARGLVTGSLEAALALAADPDLADLAARFTPPELTTTYDRLLEVVVDRVRARYGAWYEFFPRSQGTDPTRGATLREAERRLPAIRAMGFDVLYLTPIHPIGQTNRKGPNNTLRAGPDDPGSPYAIGSPSGGHTAIEPALGTLDDFDHFQRAARAEGLELALDFAIQVSPDHPWVQEHPDWFYRRPDGTIKYAENPPKKYEDIYPVNFHNPDWRGLWNALAEVIEFWAAREVRIFRVDNPHTKPFDFWAWLIARVQRRYPDAVFLSEAFTRPKVMRVLAKLGFTQSYTYFTWRNEKREIEEYLTEITSPPVSEYFRGNLFANTPDILPQVLQQGGPPAFRLRLVLAATTSSTYGIYSGFELCENRARPDSEVYQDSEMYQHKVWDWDRPGNIVDLVAQVNRIRRENPALQLYDNLRFYPSDDPWLLCYGKRTPDRSNIIVVVLNLDPFAAHEGLVHLPTAELGLPADGTYEAHDLLTEARYTWRGSTNWVRLDPRVAPAHILRLGQDG